MKILLVVPLHRKQNFKRYFQPAPLSLMTVAALTPPDVDVQIIDETVETLEFDAPADLVGIGSNTSEIVRAYEICDLFKRRGKTVVMGGIHVSALPEEALKHADSVVIGEAEGLWEQLLDDFRLGCLKKVYRHQTLPDIKKLTLPNRHILKGKRYLTKNVCQVSRGCPYRCVFCSVTEFFGNKFRVRDENRVIEEIKEMEGNFLIFLDDNIFGNPVFAARLMEKLIPLKKKWVSQCTLGLADNRKLLDLAVQSGCMGMLVGLESVSKDSLKASGKPIKFGQYADRIRRIIDSGIHVDGSFVFGFDNEDASIFERTLEFIFKIKLSAATFSILTPYPGTSLRQSLEHENRIIDRNWEHYNGTHTVFQPARMTPKQLEEGRAWVKQEFYGFANIVKRVGFRTNRVFYLWLYNLLKQGGTSKGKNTRMKNPNYS
ncbi:B12-binding domain-containing radical SAM protein [Thermodesulfobacteriota bacterium]